MTTDTSRRSPRIWVMGARPRTLGAALAPVAVGTAVALESGPVSAPRALGALVVALALQIATNFANDLADGRRGLDGPDRVGPTRLVGSGLATARQVKRAMVLSFAVALLAGSLLALVVGPELFGLGAVCVVAGWAYTGGRHPYGYAGLGEVSVFCFFGLVATAGSTYVQTGRISVEALTLGAAVGLVSAALLVVNNLRDRRGDADLGKRTLAVRLGDARTRTLFTACFVGATLLVGASAARWGLPIALGLVIAPAAVRPVLAVRSGAGGPDLVPVLADTGRILLFGGILLAVGVTLAA